MSTVTDTTQWITQGVMFMSAKDSAKQQRAIGERLAELRKARSITQKEMATQLKVTQSMVSDYENGVFRIHGDLIVKIANTLNISADELLGLTKTTKETAPIKNKRIYKKLRDIDRLPKRDQDALLRTINAFLATAKQA